MSKDFETLEEGFINGEPYYVARRLEDGWTRCFLGAKRKRRTMRWLKKQKKLALESGKVLVSTRAAPKRNDDAIVVNAVAYQPGEQPPYPGVTIDWAAIEKADDPSPTPRNNHD